MPYNDFCRFYDKKVMLNLNEVKCAQVFVLFEPEIFGWEDPEQCKMQKQIPIFFPTEENAIDFRSEILANCDRHRPAFRKNMPSQYAEALENLAGDAPIELPLWYLPPLSTRLFPRHEGTKPVRRRLLMESIIQILSKNFPLHYTVQQLFLPIEILSTAKQWKLIPESHESGALVNVSIAYYLERGWVIWNEDNHEDLVKTWSIRAK